MLEDVRFAIRQLLKSPGFASVAVFTLAVAIGACTAMFSAVDAVLLHPLPYPDPDRLMTITENLPHYGLVGLQPSFSEFLEYRRMTASFSQFAAITGTDATLTGEGQPEEAEGKRVTSAAFPMLGIKPVLGGLFTTDDEQYGRNHVVIISEGLWKRRYGADRAIVGKKIQINRESFRVVGVIQSTPGSSIKADLWMPLAFAPADMASGSSGPHYIDVIGRLRPGITIEQARDEFRRIAARMVELYPNQDKRNLGFSIDVNSLADEQAGDLRKPLWLLLGAVGAVMLIACANVSNLLLARGMKRHKEISLRLALGASRSRLVRQLLTESMLLAVIACSVGLLLALGLLHLYTESGPRDLISGSQPAINGVVMAFSLVLSITASIIFGVLPALETSGTDVNDALKEVSHGSRGVRRILRESIVVVEVAASLTLLIGAGLLVRSFVHVESINPGFRSEKVMTALIPLPMTDYPQSSQRMVFERALLERVRALPGVILAGAIDFLPFEGNVGSHIEIPGQVQKSKEPTEVVYQTALSSGYLETMAIPLLRGRRIDSSDDLSPIPVCNIDDTVARKFFANSEPLGMQVVLPVPELTCTIVGVVGATKARSLLGSPTPRIYYSSQMPFPHLSLIMKATRDPLALASLLRHELTVLNPNLPFSPRTMDEILADSLARQRFSIRLVTAFAAIATLLSAVGIYSVVAYLVDRRRRELGIRLAVGARAGNLVALVLRQGFLPVGIGLACGIGGAFAMTRYLKSVLYEIGATDPLVFTGASVGLVSVALLAMAVPAYRATRVDPLKSLRHE